MVVRNVDVTEAKSDFFELLDRVEAGEVIAITRHGKQIALLGPARLEQAGGQQAIERLRQVRKGSRLGDVSTKQLRDEGRL